MYWHARVIFEKYTFPVALTANYHRHSTSPVDRPRTPLYGLYGSLVILSWSTFNDEKVCCSTSNLTRKAREGRDTFVLRSGISFWASLGVLELTHVEVKCPRRVKLDDGATFFISHRSVYA